MYHTDIVWFVSACVGEIRELKQYARYNNKNGKSKFVSSSILSCCLNQRVQTSYGP